MTEPVFFHGPTEGKIFRETFCADYGGENLNMCTRFSMTSHWEGERAPTIRFLLLWEDGSEIYASNGYTPAKNGAGCCWRVPPFQKRGVSCRAEVTVPEGTAVTVESYCARYEEYAPKGTGAEMDAHLGFFGAAPENTYSAFCTAGLCGFHSCITVPKRTKDGVYVCIHDDTIGRTARDEDGNAPKTDFAVEDMTYEELLTWDFGLARHPVFRGEKIPLLEDYFRICKAYGMKPIFSVHPCFSPAQWQEIGVMLERQGLLGTLRVKSSILEELKAIRNVYGDAIGGYILWDDVYSENMLGKLMTLGLDLTRTRGTVEAVHTPESPWTAERVHRAEGQGISVSALTCWAHHTGDYYKDLMAMGVREYTEDYHCSEGLAW